MAKTNANSRVVITVSVVAALIGLVILVGMVIALIQRNQAPTDSQATGFGDEATSDLYDPTAELFLNTECDYILDGNASEYVNTNELKKLGVEFSSLKLAPEDQTPLICEFFLGEGKSVTLTVFSYSPDSEIDDSFEDLYARVNGEVLESTINSGSIGIMDYFYGFDAADNSKCRTVMYHPLNDFESAQLVYEGFTCNEIIALNQELSSILSTYLFSSLDFVYREYAETTTEDLLYEWDLADRVPSLTYYLISNETE